MIPMEPRRIVGGFVSSFHLVDSGDCSQSALTLISNANKIFFGECFIWEINNSILGRLRTHGLSGSCLNRCLIASNQEQRKISENEIFLMRWKILTTILKSALLRVARNESLLVFLILMSVRLSTTTQFQNLPEAQRSFWSWTWFFYRAKYFYSREKLVWRKHILLSNVYF